MDTPEKRRWYSPSPAWLVFGTLLVTGLLWLSERWQWFWFNEHKGWTVLIAVSGAGVVGLLVILLWFIVALLFRWQFQFSIQSLLVLTVAVAIPFRWLAVEMKRAREQRERVEAIVKSGGSVIYDYQLMPMLAGIPNPARPRPVWLWKLLGDDFFANIYEVAPDPALSPAAR